MLQVNSKLKTAYSSKDMKNNKKDEDLISKILLIVNQKKIATYHFKNLNILLYNKTKHLKQLISQLTLLYQRVKHKSLNYAQYQLIKDYKLQAMK